MCYIEGDGKCINAALSQQSGKKPRTVYTKPSTNIDDYTSCCHGFIFHTASHSVKCMGNDSPNNRKDCEKTDSQES